MSAFADEALRLGQAERVRGGHARGRLQRRCGGPGRQRCGPGIRNGRSSQGRKAVPSAVPPSFGVCRTHLTDGSADGSVDPGRRSALPCIAGALRRSLLGIAPVRSGGSRVHSPASPSRFPPTTGSLDRRALATRPAHRPFFVMSAESRPLPVGSSSRRRTPVDGAPDRTIRSSAGRAAARPVRPPPGPR